MSSGKVRIPTPYGGYRIGKFEPVWGGAGEVPLCVREYTEGRICWYGSGTLVVEVTVVPIVVRLPIAAIGGVVQGILPESRRRGWAMALKKVATGTGSVTGGGPGAADKAQWPGLWEHLTEDRYPDATPRKVSSIIVVGGAEGWRVCLSDKDNGRTMWKTGATLEEALQALEQGVQDDDPSQWRQSAEAKWKGKKKG